MLKKGSPNPLAGMAGQLWNRLFVHLPIHTEERRGRGGGRRESLGESSLLNFLCGKRESPGLLQPPLIFHLSLRGIDDKCYL